MGKKHLFDSPCNPTVKAEEDIEKAAENINNSEMSNTPGKPTAIVKPHSDSMEKTDEKPKKAKKPLPPKPWLKKKKNPSSPAKPASSGSYNLDFLDKLDDPNFDPFTTKTKVTNDQEDQPLASKPSGYNLDFLDQMDDPNFNPFETKTKVVNESPEKNSEKIQEKIPEQIQEKNFEDFSEKIQENISEKIEENLEILHLEPQEKFQHFEEPMVPETKPAFDFEPNFEIPKFTENSEEKFDEAENFDFDHFNTKSSKAATPIDLPLLEILEKPKKKKDSTPEFEKAEIEIENQEFQKPQRVLSDKVKEELARNELIFQAQLLEKDKELHAKEKQVQMVDHEVHKLKMELKSLTEGNVEMMKVVQEYEKTISEIISDRERERVCQEIEKEKLIRERDQALEDLRASERGYYDVHRKYERTKEVIAGCLKNEKILKARESEVTQKYNHSLEQFKKLEEHASGKLQQANEEVAGLQRARENERAQLQAMLRKAEMKVNNLERVVE